MYELSFSEMEERDCLLTILYNRGLIPVIYGSKLIVYNTDFECLFKKKIDDLFINDICDILNVFVTDSKYIYYLIDIAYENSKVKSFQKCKKKSL